VSGEHAAASEPTETGANDEEIGETPISVANDAAKRVIVSFESDPTGAIVRLDDHLLCQDNSKGCKRVVEAGQHTLAIEKEGYISRRESITVTATTDRVHKKLDKNVGWLSVRSKPSGLEVKLDTRVIGKTPIERHEVVPGTHEVLVTNRVYFDKGKRICSSSRSSTGSRDR